MGNLPYPRPMDQPCLLFEQPNELAEGPLWDDRTQTLYWLNIVTGTVWRALFCGGDPQDPLAWTSPEGWSPSSRVGALGLAEDGRLVAGLEEGVGLFAWGGEVRILAPLPFDGTRVCFNDGKVGPDGAFWVGSKDRLHREAIGNLVRVDSHGNTRVMIEGLTISNGFDWIGSSFLHTESMGRTILKYEWDLGSGTLGFPVPFAGREGPGVPDGLTIDSEGCVWVARWGGSQMVRLSPRGEVLERIALPVSRVSSCAFAGPDLDILMVTTAREGLGPADRTTESLAGSVFSLRVPVPGRPLHRWIGAPTPESGARFD